MIGHGSYVICDGCGNPGEIVTDGSSEARVAAKREGFVRTEDGQDLCRLCDPNSRFCTTCGIAPSNWLVGCTARDGIHTRATQSTDPEGETK